MDRNWPAVASKSLVVKQSGNWFESCGRRSWPARDKTDFGPDRIQLGPSLRKPRDRQCMSVIDKYQHWIMDVHHLLILWSF